MSDKKPRYSFVPNEKRPGYVQVVDHMLLTVTAEFWHEHAMMIAMMYQNQWQQNAFAADEFMYGHLLGYTYTLLNQDKYPKVERIEEGNTTILKFLMPDGQEYTVNPEVQGGVATNDLQDEQVKRLGDPGNIG